MGENPLEALTLFVRRDLAAHANMRDRGHEHEESPGQRDVAGDARALLRDRFLRDLNENFLAGLQQIADDRQVGCLRSSTRLAAATISLAVASAATTATATAIAARLYLTPGCGLAFCGGVLRFVLVFFLFALDAVFFVLFDSSLVIKVQLDAMIEMRFLQHLAQFT